MLLLSVPAAGGQEPTTTSHGYTVFVGGTVVGREEVTVRVTADGVTITGNRPAVRVTQHRDEARRGALSIRLDAGGVRD